MGRLNLLRIFALIILLTSCSEHHKLKPANFVALNSAIKGNFCSKVTYVDMPVKILFVIDVSGSNKTTDTVQNRLKAYREVLDFLIPKDKALDPAHYHFGLITFSSEVRRITDGFLNPAIQGDQAWKDLYSGDGIDTGDMSLVSQDGWTNYAGAMKEAKEFIKDDMTSTEPKKLVSRTRYVVLFVSDGIPETDGEPNSSFYIEDGVCSDGSGGAPYFPKGVIVNGKAKDYCIGPYGKYLFGEVYSKDGTNSVYSTIESTKPYGENMFWVNDGGRRFAPLSVEWNTFFYGEYEAGDPLQQTKDKIARSILGDIAYWGKGNFVDLSQPDKEFSFLTEKINLAVSQMRYQLQSIYINNRNKVVTKDFDSAPDSDADLLHDELERKLGTDPMNRDSDGDGLSDGVEYLKLNTDPLKDDDLCGRELDRKDMDHDGLTACEENFLSTQDSLFDTDGDFIPDGLEVRYGLKPARPDRDEDYDLDQISNFHEVTSHTNPWAPERQSFEDENLKFSFKITEIEKNFEGNNCYSLELKNLDIMKTQTGRNIIDIFVIQVSEEDPTDFGVFSYGAFVVNFESNNNGNDSTYGFESVTLKELKLDNE